MSRRTGWSAEMDRKADEIQRDPVAYFEKLRHQQDDEASFGTTLRRLFGVRGHTPRGYEPRRSAHP